MVTATHDDAFKRIDDDVCTAQKVKDSALGFRHQAEPPNLPTSKAKDGSNAVENEDRTQNRAGDFQGQDLSRGKVLLRKKIAFSAISRRSLRAGIRPTHPRDPERKEQNVLCAGDWREPPSDIFRRLGEEGSRRGRRQVIGLVNVHSAPRVDLVRVHLACQGEQAAAVVEYVSTSILYTPGKAESIERRKSSDRGMYQAIRHESATPQRLNCANLSRSNQAWTRKQEWQMTVFLAGSCMVICPSSRQETRSSLGVLVRHCVTIRLDDT